MLYTITNLAKFMTPMTLITDLTLKTYPSNLDQGSEVHQVRTHIQFNCQNSLKADQTQEVLTIGIEYHPRMWRHFEQVCYVSSLSKADNPALFCTMDTDAFFVDNDQARPLFELSPLSRQNFLETLLSKNFKVEFKEGDKLQYAQVTPKEKPDSRITKIAQFYFIKTYPAEKDAVDTKAI